MGWSSCTHQLKNKISNWLYFHYLGFNFVWDGSDLFLPSMLEILWGGFILSGIKFSSSFRFLQCVSIFFLFFLENGSSKWCLRSFINWTSANNLKGDRWFGQWIKAQLCDWLIMMCGDWGHPDLIGRKQASKCFNTNKKIRKIFYVI